MKKKFDEGFFMLTFLFPGQGSQTKGMGKELFDEFPELIKEADKILNYSIKTLCLENPEEKLNQTQFTQPAIFIVNALTYLKKIKQGQAKPDYVAGHSLGEYNALFAAEVFDFKTGLELVKKRGELMSQASNGGMAAIIGLQIEAVEQVLKETNLTNVAIANHNSYSQIVISGLKKDIEQAETFFKKINSVSFIPLKVSGAFHSHYMNQAQKEFTTFLETTQFRIPKIPVIANIDAKIYHPLVIRKNLANQMTHSVKWASTIEFLIAQTHMTFEEVGPGNVLTGLLQRIQKLQ